MNGPPPIGDVARRLLGEPNAALSGRGELRFGRKGSLSVDLAEDCWFSHEAGEGGGVFDLIRREGHEPREWLARHFPYGANGRVGDHVGRREFVYRDRDGKPLYRSVSIPRFDGGKRLWQERYEAGRWVGGKGCMDGVPRVPYRLPELRASSDVVLINEGEKHCDALAELGFVATSSVAGAGNWCQGGSLAGWFEGRDVVILPDNDEPGRGHADQIERDLKGHAKSIRRLELPGLPEKGDVINWLEAGGTAEELRLLIAEANGRCYSPFRNLTGIEARNVSWLWYPYLPAGQISLIGAPGGGGKGLNCAAYAACVTTGREWPGCHEAPEIGRVLWCEAEDPLEEVIIPRLHAAGADVTKIDYATREEFAEVGGNLRRYITDNDVRLVVMSPVVSFLELSDINSELGVRESLERLQSQIAGTRAAVVGIGHTNKKHDLRAVERLLGSVAFVNFVRSVLLVGRDQDEPDWFRLVHAKHNLSVKGDDLLYRPVHVGDDPRDQYVRLDWDKPDENVDADALFDRKKPDAPDREPTAREWLVQYLEEHGESLRAQIVIDGEKAGHKENALRVAQQREKRIAARREGFNGPVWWKVK